jgi:amino acid transporter
MNESNAVATVWQFVFLIVICIVGLSFSVHKNPSRKKISIPPKTGKMLDFTAFL